MAWFILSLCIRGDLANDERHREAFPEWMSNEVLSSDDFTPEERIYPRRSSRRRARHITKELGETKGQRDLPCRVGHRASILLVNLKRKTTVYFL